MSKSGVIDRDLGYKAIMKEVAIMRGDSHVKIGLLSDAMTEDGKQSLAKIGAANEFGVPSKNIPPRPFMRQTFEKNIGKVESIRNKAIDKLFEGKMTAKDVLEQLGERYKGMIEREIKGGDFAPNAPSTRKRKMAKNKKGAKNPEAKPLIDTGRMSQSINYEVIIK